MGSLKERLRRLPLAFRGLLHDVELVQLSLDLAEARAWLPAGLAPREVAGRALVSLVKVRLARMRPALLPLAPAFGFRHVALRILVDDSAWTEDRRPHGIFFARSFTDDALAVLGGDWLTSYRLERARLEPLANGWRVHRRPVHPSPTTTPTHPGRRTGAPPVTAAPAEIGADAARTLAWRLGGEPRAGAAFASLEEAAGVVRSLDRAWTIDAQGRAWCTRILRPAWPLEPVGLHALELPLFESARAENAFRVPLPVPYHWLAPRRVSSA